MTRIFFQAFFVRGNLPETRETEHPSTRAPQGRTPETLKVEARGEAEIDRLQHAPLSEISNALLVGPEPGIGVWASELSPMGADRAELGEFGGVGQAEKPW